MLSILFLSGLVHAQDSTTEPVSGGEIPELNAQLFRPTIDSPYLLWTDESLKMPNRYTSARFLLDYANDPLVYTPNGGEPVDLVGNLLQLDMMAGHTRGPLRVGLHLPVYLRSTGAAGGETGLGDLGVDFKGTLLDRTDGGLGAALNVRLMLPTATVDAPLGAHGFGWELAAIADAELGEKMILAANLGTRGVPKVELENVTWGSQLFFRAGAGYLLSDNAGLSLDLAGNFTYADISNGAALPMEALVGGWGRLGDSNLVLRGGVGTGLTGGIGAPKFRAVFALGYEPPRGGDKDGDGIYDVSDACIDVPEDKDTYEDSDGCPEATVVTFKFVDEENKPVGGVAFNATAGDTSLDGTESNNSGSFAAGAGALKGTAEGYQPFEQSFTVPDGQPIEVVQKLAYIPGKVTVKVQTEDGKPVPGATWFVDNADRGDASSGTANADLKPGPHVIAAAAPGFLKDSAKVGVKAGETTEVTIILKPTKVDVQKERIDLRDSVYFELDKDIIKPESYQLLKDVAKTMNEYPEILVVRIEGHTDSRGDAEYNQDLSDRRAKAVREFLIKEGVAPERLVAFGYGESKPLVQGENDAAWAKNRRVDFFIEKRSDEPAKPERKEEPKPELKEDAPARK